MSYDYDDRHSDPRVVANETISFLRARNSELEMQVKEFTSGMEKPVPISGPGRSRLEIAIVNVIGQCIDAHGPITKEWAPSAAKRVIGVIKAHNREMAKAEENKRG